MKTYNVELSNEQYVLVEADYFDYTRDKIAFYISAECNSPTATFNTENVERVHTCREIPTININGYDIPVVMEKGETVVPLETR